MGDSLAASSTDLRFDCTTAVGSSTGRLATSLAAATARAISGLEDMSNQSSSLSRSASSRASAVTAGGS